MAKQYTFNKDERLKSRKLIEHLFQKGKSFSAYPFKVIYDFNVERDQLLQAGVAVSSRNFKRAVERNRVKRVIREVCRLQKLPLQNLLKEQDKHLIVFFIYTGKELPVFDELKARMETVLQKLLAVIQNQSQ